MSKKLTILIEDSVYEGLHRVVGRGSISKFIEDLARPHVTHKDLAGQYREAARDTAREIEARAWTEGLIGSVDETQDKAMADQITTADKQRLKKRIGKLSTSEMLGIERAIKVQLGLR